jgi:hypothetical protein
MVSANCSAEPTLARFFSSGEFVDGWICAMTGGDAATALLIFGVIFGGIELSLFVSTRSVISAARERLTPTLRRRRTAIHEGDLTWVWRWCR